MRLMIVRLCNCLLISIWKWAAKTQKKGRFDFTKMFGYVIVVVQHWQTMQVLMVGVMNEEAFRITLEAGHVTFWTRTRECLWTKGESSGNFLNVKEILVDCDSDTLLIMADPVGPTCHTGAVSCFENIDGTMRRYEEEAQNG